MKKIYLDYAAATPAAEGVIEAIKPYFREEYGNAGSLHGFGQRALSAIDNAREIIASELEAKPEEIFFTGSATEANNIALRGAVAGTKIKEPHVIISDIEHESVMETAEALEKNGVRVSTIPVSREGIVDIEKLKTEITAETVLISIIFGSNVIGTIQPIGEIGKLIKELKNEERGIYPLFHTDAVQAIQFIKLDVEELEVDLLTLSGQKIYGPKGVGTLYIKEAVQDNIVPLITGGEQESGMRAGTENVSAIVGMGAAVELISGKREEETERIKNLQRYFLEELKKIEPNAELNGSGKERLPNNLNIYFPGINTYELLVALDQEGISVSVGSACSSRSFKPPHAIKALNLGEDRVKESIRFTLGAPTTKEEIDTTIETLKRIIEA